MEKCWTNHKPARSEHIDLSVTLNLADDSSGYVTCQILRHSLRPALHALRAGSHWAWSCCRKGWLFAFSAPCPTYQANQLIQGAQSPASTVVGRCCTAGVEPNNGIFNRAETALPSRTDCRWICKARARCKYIRDFQMEVCGLSRASPYQPPRTRLAISLAFLRTPTCGL